jgi:hypothetical protein
LPIVDCQLAPKRDQSEIGNRQLLPSQPEKLLH